LGFARLTANLPMQDIHFQINPPSRFRSFPRPQERVLLRLRQGLHAIDVMVPVALYVRDPQQVHPCQVLLHRQAGLRRQVLA
jgi:hypothetical protein